MSNLMLILFKQKKKIKFHNDKICRTSKKKKYKIMLSNSITVYIKYINKKKTLNDYCIKLKLFRIQKKKN